MKPIERFRTRTFGNIEYGNLRDELFASLDRYRQAMNWIVNNASSFGLEAEPYVRRAKAALASESCDCQCHKAEHNGGWLAVVCCPDCGASIVEIGPGD